MKLLLFPGKKHGKIWKLFPFGRPNFVSPVILASQNLLVNLTWRGGNRVTPHTLTCIFLFFSFFKRRVFLIDLACSFHNYFQLFPPIDWTLITGFQCWPQNLDQIIQISRLSEYQINFYQCELLNFGNKHECICCSSWIYFQGLFIESSIWYHLAWIAHFALQRKTLFTKSKLTGFIAKICKACSK